MGTGPVTSAASIVIASLLAGCAAAAQPEATVVDVVVSAPVASASAVSVAASTVKVAAEAAPSERVFEDPRRVLQAPPPLPPPPLGTSSVPPQTATPLAPANAGTLSAVFTAVSLSHTSGSTPEGQIAGGSFKQGDVLHVPLTLQPGRCYTVVGVSAGITELDMSLVVAAMPGIPLQTIVLAIDATSGPTAVIGSNSSCFKNPTPIPMPAIAVVRATKGAGAALAQAFSR